MNLLKAVLADIRKQKDISKFYISDIYICSPFTVVKLNDGSIGSAGNYDIQNNTKSYDPSEIKKNYLKLIKNDPLLLDFLTKADRYVDISLKVAILSALSQSLLTAECLSQQGIVYRECVDYKYILEKKLISDDNALLIGYGGALETFCQSKKIKNLIVCDFMFEKSKYRDIAWLKIKNLRDNLAKVKLVSSIVGDNCFSNTNVCYITGSALCNETMEVLLKKASPCREIILQGPSCSLYPIEFFRRCVTLLLTNKKSNKEFELGMRVDDHIYDLVDSKKIALYQAKR